MNSRARKYSKILYFPDKQFNQLVTDTATTKTKQPPHQGKNKKIDKHYPFNCISRFYPFANSEPHEQQFKYVLPCGFMYGETWGALKKSWIGYKRAKSDNDRDLMIEYAKRIQTLETQLGIPTASFPNLGIIGDLFFLYDKQKESELRHKYAAEKIVCDKFGSKSIDELVDEGKAIVFNTTRQVDEYRQKENWQKYTFSILDEWAKSEKTQEYFRANERNWTIRAQLRNEIKEIKKELQYYSDKYPRYKKAEEYQKTDPKMKKAIEKRRKQLLQKKILKEAELASAKAVQLVKTDTGWKYVKQILLDNLREKVLFDHEPTYYLTDPAGHRLADYKEELEYMHDPQFYRLYLEQKEWEKIYSKETNTNTDSEYSL
jgi:hypothetical protein